MPPKINGKEINSAFINASLKLKIYQFLWFLKINAFLNRSNSIDVVENFQLWLNYTFLE